MTLTVSSDKSICSAMKDATDCHAIEPEENQAKKNKLEKFDRNSPKTDQLRVCLSQQERIY